MSNPQPPNQLNQLEQGRLAALYRVSQALGASLDLDEVLTQVMDSVISLTGAERGFLVLTEPGGTEWQLRAARNFSRESLQLKDMAVSRTAINTVIQSRAGLVTTDAQTDPRFSEHESVIFHALRSILCAPLLARGQAIGAIYVDNRAQAGLFTEPDLQLLSAFASQAAIAIQNAALYTRTDQALAQRVAELETLARVDAELNASLELPRVLELTCQWALDGGQAQQAWVWLDAPAGSDQPAVTHPQPTDADGEALARQAAAARRPQAAKSPAGQRLAIPLLHGGTALGALLVERAAPAAPAGAAEAAFLERLAGRAASAIQNTRLYAEV
ncbi:MAG: GAF domain-containing protein [Chloroflexota bacterium]